MEIFDKYYDEHNLEERSQYSGFSKKQLVIEAEHLENALSRVLVDKTKSGKVRPWREKKNLDDTEEGDLIHTDDDEKADEDGFSIIAMWNWERKNYFIKE